MTTLNSKYNEASEKIGIHAGLTQFVTTKFRYRILDQLINRKRIFMRFSSFILSSEGRNRRFYLILHYFYLCFCALPSAGGSCALSSWNLRNIRRWILAF